MRWHGQINRRAACLLQFVLNRPASRGIGVVDRDVAQSSRELFKCCRINSAVLFQAIVHSLPELIETPSRPGYADDGHIETSTPNHRLQRRKNFLKSQIACHPVDNQCVRMFTTHANPPSTQLTLAKLQIERFAIETLLEEITSIRSFHEFTKAQPSPSPRAPRGRRR